MDKENVVSPVGLDAVERSGAARRLDDLNGKTVGEFWNGVFKGDITFPIIRKLLQDRFPTLKIIPYTEFPYARGSDIPTRQQELAREVARLAKNMGCDALISGNGA